MEKRKEVLEKQIAAELTKAKAYMKAGNKSGKTHYYNTTHTQALSRKTGACYTDLLCAVFVL